MGLGPNPKPRPNYFVVSDCKIHSRIFANEIKKKSEYTGKKRGRKSKSMNPPLTIAEYEAAKLSGQLHLLTGNGMGNEQFKQSAKLSQSKKLHALILNKEQAMKQR